MGFHCRTFIRTGELWVEQCTTFVFLIRIVKFRRKMHLDANPLQLLIGKSLFADRVLRKLMGTKCSLVYLHYLFNSLCNIYSSWSRHNNLNVFFIIKIFFKSFDKYISFISSNNTRHLHHFSIINKIVEKYKADFFLTIKYPFKAWSSFFHELLQLFFFLFS
jgi:hypothetical protein